MTTRNELRAHSFRLATGVTLRCLERSGAGGDPLLLLHGYSDSAPSFAPLIAALPGDLRVVAPDQRGHGDSERPAHGYRMSDLAADAAALLDAAGIGRANVLGHSMGSLVAQQLALDHPARVSRLVLVAGSACLEGDGVAELLREVAGFTDPVSEEFIRAFQTSSIHGALPDDRFEEVIAESRKLPAHVWRGIGEGIAGFDVRPRLREITCPTLVVWGEHDATFGRAEQETLVTGIRDVTYVSYADAGHSPHWEHPDRVARDVAAFLAGPAGARAPLHAHA